MPPITIQFSTTQEDYQKGMRLYYLKDKSRWIGTGFALMFVLCLANFLVLANYREWSLGISLLLVVLTVPITLFLSIPWLFLTYFLTPWLYARRVAKNERFTTETTWKIDENEIHTESKFGETRFDWGTYAHQLENADYFVLIHSAVPNMLQILPKRSFTTPEQLDDFRSYLEGHGIGSPPLRLFRRGLVSVVPGIILFACILVVIITMVVWNLSQ